MQYWKVRKIQYEADICLQTAMPIFHWANFFAVVKSGVQVVAVMYSTLIYSFEKSKGFGQSYIFPVQYSFNKKSFAIFILSLTFVNPGCRNFCRFVF